MGGVKPTRVATKFQMKMLSFCALNYVYLMALCCCCCASKMIIRHNDCDCDSHAPYCTSHSTLLSSLLSTLPSLTAIIGVPPDKQGDYDTSSPGRVNGLGICRNSTVENAESERERQEEEEERENSSKEAKKYVKLRG